MKTKLFVTAYLAVTLPIAACTPGDDASFSSVRNTGFPPMSLSKYDVKYDRETCVQYFVGAYDSTSVRVNADGTPRLEHKCVEEMRK